MSASHGLLSSLDDMHLQIYKIYSYNKNKILLALSQLQGFIGICFRFLAAKLISPPVFLQVLFSPFRRRQED